MKQTYPKTADIYQKQTLYQSFMEDKSHNIYNNNNLQHGKIRQQYHKGTKFSQKPIFSRK